MKRCLILLLCLFALSPPALATEPKYVALTFDDGPSGRFTRRLLEGLAERDVKATFFVCGYRLKQYPELAEELCSQGHELGLHGYSHQNMKTMSRRDIAKEIMDTEALLPPGGRARFLRPPGGCCSDGVRQVARARNYAILDWSVDPRDWATKDTAAIQSAVVDQVQDGDIVLLHDMSDSSVDAALRIIDRLKADGFTFVTVSELAKRRDMDITPGQMYRKFPPEEGK